MAFLGFKKWLALTAAAGATAGAALLMQVPKPHGDHAFDRITLPPQTDQCLTNIFSDAIKKNAFTFDDKLSAEERNYKNLTAKTTELEVAGAVKNWLLTLTEDVSQSTRDKAFATACQAAKRLSDSPFPNLSVIGPLQSAQMGTTWIAHYDIKDYNNVIARLQKEHQVLSEKNNTYIVERGTSLTTSKILPTGKFTPQAPIVQAPPIVATPKATPQKKQVAQPKVPPRIKSMTAQPTRP